MLIIDIQGDIVAAIKDSCSLSPTILDAFASQAWDI